VGHSRFPREEHNGDVRNLTTRLGKRLDAERLVTEAATDEHARWFHHHWQMPMYNFDFALLPASLEQLEADREAAYWAEVGYQHHGDH
jgi:hypothetical protein